MTLTLGPLTIAVSADTVGMAVVFGFVLTLAVLGMALIFADHLDARQRRHPP